MTTSILLVDDAASLAELFARAVEHELGHRVEVVVAVADVHEALERGPYEIAIVDLSFPQERCTGLDALAEIHRHSPDTKLALFTQGDDWVAETLRDAWELLPIATVISKTAPLDYQLAAIQSVVETGSAPPDPAVQPLLPAHRPEWRTPERFAKLIQHQGHAKVWSALIDDPDDATYKSVAARTGLKLNTVKNYRSQLLSELNLHGLSDPTLREMQDFARRCRAFLRPFVDDALQVR
ncbi:MAG: DNA-binding response regulator [Ilumatobacter sp.]|nr:MAG: DNA-binding response regulator [Ilumatobacter sp.]